ncbi:MAG: DUF4180 domain-containing protein [Petrotogales bacterium]
MRLIRTGLGTATLTTNRNVLIKSAQDALDLFSDAVYEGCNNFIVYKENLSEDFFDLKTGLAGEILQKFSNYRMRLAIIGDFSKYKSKSLEAFIIESNRGNQTFFVSSVEEALKALGLEKG